MINLEWLRSFRTVYKTGSLTKAAEVLSITQPTVSQHIAALENYTGKKLFHRKSKGVSPSDYARTLNNMIAHSLDDLEEVEKSLYDQTVKHIPLINFGISEHLYPSLLKEILDSLHVKVHLFFNTADHLIKETEEGNLNYALIPRIVKNFDTDCYPILRQELILVYTPDIEIEPFEQLFSNNTKRSERWLSQQRWYSHRGITPFIKQFWMDVFDKKRPEIVPHRVIPNEKEVLFQLSKGSGLALCFDNTAKPFLEKGVLRRSKVSSTVSRDVSLLVNRKQSDQQITERLLVLLNS